MDRNKSQAYLPVILVNNKSLAQNGHLGQRPGAVISVKEKLF